MATAIRQSGGPYIPPGAEIPVAEAGLGLGALSTWFTSTAVPWLTKLLPTMGAALGAGAVGGLLGNGAGTQPGTNVPTGTEWLEMPWETTTGTGMIAPWTGKAWHPIQKVWFQTEGSQAWAGIGLETIGQPVYAWSTNPSNPQFGWTFLMFADGKIGTWKRNGRFKTWRPKRHLVIPTNLSQLPIGKLVRAERKIDRLMGKVAKKSKSLKRQ